MRQVIYNGKCFNYELIKKKKKNIGICITQDGKVLVTSPLHVDESYIHEVVVKKAQWILDKLKIVNERNKDIEKNEYINGERIYYLGKNYDIKVIEDDVKGVEIRFLGDVFEVHVNSMVIGDERLVLIKEALTNWLKEQAKVVFLERTELYGRRLNLKPNRIVIKGQKSIWGSCSTKNNINYNWRLIMAPLSVLDYVVVHELCHLKHHDHSSRFWSFVGSIMPDYMEKKKWLKENGSKLMQYE
jgi:predicted metal-dependent hydrolase